MFISLISNWHILSPRPDFAVGAALLIIVAKRWLFARC